MNRLTDRQFADFIGDNIGGCACVDDCANSAIPKIRAPRVELRRNFRSGKLGLACVDGRRIAIEENDEIGLR